LNHKDVHHLASNAFNASFLSVQEKRRLIAELDAYMAASRQ
jgi:adenosine deaminase